MEILLICLGFSTIVCKFLHFREKKDISEVAGETVNTRLAIIVSNRLKIVLLC